jgi:D-glycero-alpha-D-manno-heptose-7-phosphate kinase
MITTKTPFRFSLFGGGTDYPEWFKDHPSKCISAAMSHYCYITVKKLPAFFEYRNRIVYSKIEDVNDFNSIEHPSVKACLRHLNIPEGISITHDGELPARSGIGSSSSFTVGLLKALYTMKGQNVTPYELAMQAIHVEQVVIGENVGIQDQIMAAHGGIQIIHMGPGNRYKWHTEKVNLSEDYRKELESHILLGFSGISRIAEVQAKKQVDKIKEGLNTNLLTKMSEITNEAIDLIQKEQSIDRFGKLMDKNWRVKRILAEGITDELLDSIYVQSIANGSLGTKLMGAGGGGFFMFLVPPEKQKEFKKQMTHIKVWVPFAFDMHGSQIILNT